MKLSNCYHCLVVALIFGFIFGSFIAGTDGASRQPNSRDHIHCKMEYHEQWEDVMQTADPYAVVESYYVSDWELMLGGKLERERERVRKRAAFDGQRRRRQKTKKKKAEAFFFVFFLFFCRVCVCLQTLTLTLKVAAATAVWCLCVSLSVFWVRRKCLHVLVAKKIVMNKKMVS